MSSEPNSYRPARPGGMSWMYAVTSSLAERLPETPLDQLQRKAEFLRELQRRGVVKLYHPERK